MKNKGFMIFLGIAGAVIAGLAIALVVLIRDFNDSLPSVGEKPTLSATKAPDVEKEDVQGESTLTDMPEPTKAVEPTTAPTEIPAEPTNEPVLVPTETVEPTTAPTEVIVPTNAPVTDDPVLTEAPNVTEAVVPTVTSAATPTPTVTPTPAPQRKYIYEAKMGDNVWYRLSEDRVLYVTGTGATDRFNYTYDKETDRIYGADSRYDRLMKCLSAQHIVIEEGITKLGGWSLMRMPNIQSITFPSTLQEIEDYCFFGTGMTLNTVWIGLDKDKVKISENAFYGTVYQTEEDLLKPTPLPTLSPVPTSLPMEANAFYRALVEEAGMRIDTREEEPYSAVLVQKGIIESTDVKKADETFSNQEAAKILYNAAKVLGIAGDEEVIANAKKYDRISDKRGIVPGYEEAVYFCFGTGIIPGESDGEYSHTRSFNPKKQVREADGRMYCERLFDEAKRVPMSPDAQVLRTTNLPIQAKLYPYILESFPNEYYDTNYYYMYNLSTDDRAVPDIVSKVGFLEWWCTPSTVEEFSKKQPERCRIFTSTTDYLGAELVGMNTVVERYGDLWEQQAKRYLELILNFDYRTVREDTAWQNEIKNLSAFYTEWDKGYTNGSFTGKLGVDTWMENFLTCAEENHTVAECSAIDFDMSTLCYSEQFANHAPYTIRVHLKYRINTELEAGLFYRKEEMVLPTHFNRVETHFTSFGEWKDVYAELALGVNSFDRAGIAGIRILEYNVDDAIRYHFDPKKYVK